MNEIIEDYKRENFTLKEWVKYGIIAPLLFILTIGII